MKTRTITTGIAAAVVAACMMGAGAPATQPDALPGARAASRPLTATVISVQGIAQYRAGADKPWQMAKADMVVDIGGEFRTGPHSLVKFKIPPDQVITLDRLGTVKLLQAVENGAKLVTTDLGMKYGRVHYDVEAGDQVEHQTTIMSPSATLSTRGTDSFWLSDERPWPTEATGRNTSLVFWPRGGPLVIYFGHKGDNAYQTVDVGEWGPAEHRHHDRVTDPGDRGARTDAEFQILGTYEQYTGANFNSGGITTFHGQSTDNTQLPPPRMKCPCGDN